MPLNIPTRSEVTAAQQAYVRTRLPDLDPTITRRRGFIGGIVRSFASALHDWYVKLKRYGDREPFPQTATGEFLYQGWWGDITGLSRNAAAPAAGKITITGTAGTILSAGAAINNGGLSYTVDASTAVVSQSANAVSLTRSGTTAIFETAAPHFLSTGMTLTIAGADQSDYNISAVITVTASNEFTYTVAGSPTTPATGAVSASGDWGNADITCTTTGQDGNIDAGSSVTIDSPPVNLDSTGVVTFGGIAGGTDIESVEEYRARVLEALGTDFGTFSEDEISIVAKQIAGVTKVWVVPATLDGTNGVNEGQVKVYFVRDNDANKFPSSIEVDAVKTHLVANIMPAHTADEDVMVYAPTDQPVPFVFTAISPDTASMRRAIEAHLDAYFDDAADLETDITEDDYRCAINDAYDDERGQDLVSFTLSSPSGTVAVASGNLPTRGAITWPA